MDNKFPLSQEVLNDIFKLSPTRSNCLNSRECTTLEFKQSFNWGKAAEYARTGTAFANARGGCIVFGVKNRPHELVGLSTKVRERFEGIDPAKVSGFLNEHFAPEVQWDTMLHEIGGRHCGILYFHEATDKPIVCTKLSGDTLRESDIYYRYRGRTTTVRYAELREMLEARRRHEQRLWLKHLTQIARIGVRDAAVFSFETGEGSAPGGTFVIDESLLSQMALIREDHFSEKHGKHALRVIGDVKSVSGDVQMPKKFVKTKGIRMADIVLAFLKSERVDEPIEYLKQICFENTGFLPAYFFIHQGNLSLGDALKVIDGIVSRSPSKKKLYERLEGSASIGITLPATGTKPTMTKRTYCEALQRESVDADLQGRDLRYCLQAVRCLSEREVKRHSPYLRKLLRTWFNKHYANADSGLADALRRATCWLDEALYRAKVGD